MGDEEIFSVTHPVNGTEEIVTVHMPARLENKNYEMIVLTQSGDETSEPFHKRNINITVPAPPRATQLMKTNESSIAIEWIPVYNAKGYIAHVVGENVTEESVHHIIEVTSSLSLGDL